MTSIALRRERPAALNGRRVAELTLSGLGYVLTGAILAWGFSSGRFVIPGGDALIFDRVGDEVRAGVSPYYLTAAGYGFHYAPPWAIAYAALSWLPSTVFAWLLIGLECLALWYIAGSVKRLGWCLLFPLVAFELVSGQINLILAAGIAAALRSDPRLSTVTAFAKLSPALAIDPRQWRAVVPVAAVLVALTLPWWTLWPGWVVNLSQSYGTSIADVQIPVPLLPRLAVAVGLLALRKPWARGLAAIIAIPAPYWVTSVMVLGLMPAGPVVGGADRVRRGGVEATPPGPRGSSTRRQCRLRYCPRRHP